MRGVPGTGKAGAQAGMVVLNFQVPEKGAEGAEHCIRKIKRGLEIRFA